LRCVDRAEAAGELKMMCIAARHTRCVPDRMRGGHMRRSIWILSMALAATTVPVVMSTAQADEKGEREKVVKLEDIPAPARATIVKEAGGSPILKVELEKKDGKTVYEGVVKKGDDVIGITVDADGKLIDKHSEKAEKGEKKTE